MPELIERAGAALKARVSGDRGSSVFGHVGDGNLHYNVGPRALLAQRDEVNRIVYDAVDALGGSISAEHGLGQLKREEIRRHKVAARDRADARAEESARPAGPDESRASCSSADARQDERLPCALVRPTQLADEAVALEAAAEAHAVRLPGDVAARRRRRAP